MSISTECPPSLFAIFSSLIEERVQDARGEAWLMPCRRSTTELDIESVAQNSIGDWGAARGSVGRQNGGRDRDDADPSQQKQSV